MIRVGLDLDGVLVSDMNLPHMNPVLTTDVMLQARQWFMPIFTLSKQLKRDIEIFLVTARPIQDRELTEDFIGRHIRRPVVLCFGSHTEPLNDWDAAVYKSTVIRERRINIFFESSNKQADYLHDIFKTIHDHELYQVYHFGSFIEEALNRKILEANSFFEGI